MVVCDPDPFYAGGSGEIEAQPKVENGADYERVPDAGRFPSSGLSREIQASLGIGFPEIDSRPQPIVIVVARVEWIAPEEPLTDLPVAAMIAKNECSRKTVQGLSVIL